MAHKKTLGTIYIPHNHRPEDHELATAQIFCNRGSDVEFLKANRLKGSKTPDVQILSLMHTELEYPIVR